MDSIRLENFHFSVACFLSGRFIRRGNRKTSASELDFSKSKDEEGE